MVGERLFRVGLECVREGLCEGECEFQDQLLVSL